MREKEPKWEVIRLQAKGEHIVDPDGPGSMG